MGEPAIVVDQVSKSYRLYHEREQSLKATILHRGRSRYEEFWALRDVSLEIPAGRTFGLIGENGSGKSTLLKCIARILQPNAGRIGTNGKVAALLELGSGFHPELTGRENVYLNGSILGLSKREIDAKFDQISEFAGVGQFIDQPVKNYSSGMYMRLGFSVAIHVDPDVLLVDEILAVGDAVFQRKCAEKFLDLRRRGKTVVIVSHATDAIRNVCDEVVRLDHGKLVAVGPADEVIDQYIDEGHVERETIAGGVVRWGSGEARITDLMLLDSEGAPTTHVRTGEAVTVRLRFDAAKTIERPVFGLALETVDGVYVWAHNTRDAGFEIDSIDGAGTAEYRIPSLPLQPGTFDIHVSVVDFTTTHVFDYLRAAYRFDVGPGRPRESGGILTMNGSWAGVSVSPEASGVP